VTRRDPNDPYPQAYHPSARRVNQAARPYNIRTQLHREAAKSAEIIYITPILRVLRGVITHAANPRD